MYHGVTGPRVTGSRSHGGYWFEHSEGGVCITGSRDHGVTGAIGLNIWRVVYVSRGDGATGSQGHGVTVAIGLNMRRVVCVIM
jgi:hypothetical protein